MSDEWPGELRFFRSLSEAVRRRPAMYIGRDRMDLETLYVVISRFVEDAARDDGINRATQIDVCIYPDDSVVISDNGRGLPVDIYDGWLYAAYGTNGLFTQEEWDRVNRETDSGKIVPPEVRANPKIRLQPIIEVTFTRVFTGGATVERIEYFGFPYFDAAILNALCAEMEVQTTRDGNLYEISFKQCELDHPLTLIGPSTAPGTRVRFLPDKSIYSPEKLDPDRLAEVILEATRAYQDVTVTVSHQSSKGDG